MNVSIALASMQYLGYELEESSTIYAKRRKIIPGELGKEDSVKKSDRPGAVLARAMPFSPYNALDLVPVSGP